MVNRSQSALFAVIGVLAGCAGNRLGNSSAPEYNEVASIEELDSGEDGSRVRVHGWIEINPETFRLWTDVKKREELQDTHCIGVVVPPGADRALLDRSEVVVTGHFIADVAGKYVVLGGCRNRRFIFAEEIQRKTGKN